MLDNGKDDLYRAHGVELSCPRCQRAQALDLWVIADTAREPELLAQVAEAGLNSFECRACHHRFTAPTPVLFHDAQRRRALVFVPTALGDPEPLVNGLLSRYLRGAGEVLPGDYLLEPTIYREVDEFAAAVAGAGELAAGAPLHPGLGVTLDWCRERGETEAARLLDALTDVADLPQLLAALNSTPGLLEPAAPEHLSTLADEAEAEGDAATAEVLRDVAALLRVHTPAGDEDEEVAEVRQRLAAGDMEAAAEFLELPERDEDEETLRAMQVALEPEEREGFSDHARLFGGLVEEMMLSVTPESLEPEGEPPAAARTRLSRLLAAGTVEEALAVLRRHPALISRETVLELRRAEAAALDRGDEALASHLAMLVHTLYVAADDEDEEGLEEADDELNN